MQTTEIKVTNSVFSATVAFISVQLPFATHRNISTLLQASPGLELGDITATSFPYCWQYNNGNLIEGTSGERFHTAQYICWILLFMIHHLEEAKNLCRNPT